MVDKQIWIKVNKNVQHDSIKKESYRSTMQLKHENERN